ncbi:Serine/threonine/tyrosine-interacting protein B [Araneus ventricosus]|uniref:Serine/threonine/tyrosine-interacting protein B n=1 Tax=Araneus ventricosus TaxID=182803 RepID=A0A4Y2CKR2_ARAVE|nr:Serine/threonine/tyrosine-interacting protein B [Araneus ventricosus]
MDSASLHVENPIWRDINCYGVVSSEWCYYMRREMQEIIPGLYLGPLSAATKPKLNTLLEAGITHIVCVRHEKEASFIKPNFPENFK